MNGLSAYRKLDGLTPEEQAFCKALRGNIKDKETWSLYGDWLEDAGRIVEAWEAREKAGRCRLSYRMRHVSTGEMMWFSASGISLLRHKVRRRAADGRLFVQSLRRYDVVQHPNDYCRPLSEFEVVLEVKHTERVATLPYREDD